jgi:hypothetical protein
MRVKPAGGDFGQAIAWALIIGLGLVAFIVFVMTFLLFLLAQALG